MKVKQILLSVLPFTLFIAPMQAQQVNLEDTTNMVTMFQEV
jgi:hypothetical protein